ncbi:hypothetical protein [Cryptosporangium sp. NPDC048952]|uniref:hypothetical protein n=1 Tax=Cryptosporangium sp. NPDC048952 TaxID=3363961 RepID=UPI0037118C27
MAEDPQMRGWFDRLGDDKQRIWLRIAAGYDRIDATRFEDLPAELPLWPTPGSWVAGPFHVSVADHPGLGRAGYQLTDAFREFLWAELDRRNGNI